MDLIVLFVGVEFNAIMSAGQSELLMHQESSSCWHRLSLFFDLHIADAAFRVSQFWLHFLHMSNGSLDFQLRCAFLSRFTLPLHRYCALLWLLTFTGRCWAMYGSFSSRYRRMQQFFIRHVIYFLRDLLNNWLLLLGYSFLVLVTHLLT